MADECETNYDEIKDAKAYLFIEKIFSEPYEKIELIERGNNNMSQNQLKVIMNSPIVIKSPHVQRAEVIECFSLNINPDVDENYDIEEEAPEIAVDHKDNKYDNERHQDSSGAIFYKN